MLAVSCLSLSSCFAQNLAASMAWGTSSVVGEFFHQLFLHPTQNLPAVGVLCGGVIAACAAVAFLVMFLYKKHCVESPQLEESDEIIEQQPV